MGKVKLKTVAASVAATMARMAGKTGNYGRFFAYKDVEGCETPVRMRKDKG
jgi:hypothetical protein